MANRRLLVCFMAPFVLAMDNPPERLVPDRASDPIAHALEVARLSYEDAMEKVRAESLAALNKREKDLLLKPDKRNPNAMAELNAQRDLFMSDGEWPTVVPSGKYKSAANSARKRLIEALKAAKAGYHKADSLPLLAAVNAELDSLLGTDDIAPWGLDLMSTIAVADRTIGAGKSEINIQHELDGDYRIDIVARRLKGNGPLTVEIPVNGGKRIVLTTPSGNESEVRVMLSIANDMICADAGMARPINMTNAVEADDTDITLRAGTSAFVIEKVRVKRMKARDVENDAAPAKQEKPAAPQPATKRKTDNSAKLFDAFPAGKKWRGRWCPSAGRQVQCSAAVTQNDGESMRMRVTSSMFNNWEYRFRMNGNNLVLEDIVPAGVGRGGNVSDVSGRGYFKGRTFCIYAEFKYSGGKKTNNNVSGTFELTPD